MFQTIKKIIKILALILLVLITVAVSAYIYIDKNDVVTKKLKGKDYVSFSVLLYGTEKIFPGRLDVYTALYDKRTNILKVLSVNTDAVVLKKREKARSLKTMFNENSKKDINAAIKKLYLDLYEIIGNAAAADFYINTTFEMFDIAAGRNKKFLKDNFENRDLESLNRLETVEYFMHLPSPAIMKIYKNYGFFDTNIPKLSFMSSALRTKSLKPILMFCEMPVKYTKARVEFDKQNIEEFLNKIYYAVSVPYTNTKDVLIDIKNASKKPRMAEKAAWLLRKNKLDVLEWSNLYATYYKTLIKDYKGNFMQALIIAEILKTGKVIVSYNNRIFSDIDIFIGKDCIIT
ncbi:hypothetical protein AGMMS5026_00340 [Endomicrobiia bacterium]|nr:hypothetical protein AGMMS49523_05390 [Endomicrobiia bacterium]GHT11451.1 hypothetical protein AGMMS49571_01760 [Endomicrobiia bacterium]GHT20390.1 hypothetical protein AGMMS49929_06790 [Endomicrobiia bacterium]GHT27463.1 hypothetical protein AGMMS49995_06550 [Endomicrobiia bacterium]GHT29359.1 hypothetical protein AGMMS5026_00340 [Endomicrobiia bacterium]